MRLLTIYFLLQGHDAYTSGNVCVYDLWCVPDCLEFLATAMMCYDTAINSASISVNTAFKCLAHFATKADKRVKRDIRSSGKASCRAFCAVSAALSSTIIAGADTPIET